MLKKRSKIIKHFFLIIFIMQIAGFIFLLNAPQICLAGGVTGSWDYVPAVFDANVPGLVGPDATIGTYVQAVYKYAIGIVGILATVVMMWGGVVWITAAGNTERISNAKSWISASLTGLVLALASYTILYTVNPDLVKFKPLNVSNLGKDMTCCGAEGPTTGKPIYDKNGNVTFECPNNSTTCTENQECKLKGTIFECMEKPNRGESCSSDSDCHCFPGKTPKCRYNNDDPAKLVCFCI